jgi:hypothetical protein
VHPYELLVIAFAALCVLDVALSMRRVARVLKSGPLAGPAGDPGPAGPPGPPGKDALPPPHQMAQSAPPPEAHGISRVQRWVLDQWVDAEHVRQNTPAWKKAWDEPGTRLVDEAGNIELGNQ